MRQRWRRPWCDAAVRWIGLATAIPMVALLGPSSALGQSAEVSDFAAEPPVDPAPWGVGSPPSPASHGPPAAPRLPPGPWRSPVPPAAPTPQRPAPPETDPLLPTGITLAVLGTIGVFAGAIAYVEGDRGGDEHCGLSGCFRRPDRDLQLGGVGLMAGGGALTLMSLPLMAVGASGQPPVRHDDAMMAAGVAVTSLAIAGAAGSLGALVGQSQSVQPHENDSEVGAVAVPLLIGSAALLGLGIPLWAVGAQDWEPPELRDPDEPVRPGEEGLPQGVWVQRSAPMMVTGIVLCSLAGVSTVAGAAAMVEAEAANDSCDHCDFAGFTERIGGASLLGLAGLLALVGIPLWAVGASETLVAPDDPRAAAALAREPSPVPVVTLGLGSIRLEGRF